MFFLINSEQCTKKTLFKEKKDPIYLQYQTHTNAFVIHTLLKKLSIMNFLKIVLITCILFFSAVGLSAQTLYYSCIDQGAFTMEISDPIVETDPDRTCYIVTITPRKRLIDINNVFFMSSYDGYCTTTFSSSDDNLSAAFCFGENSCSDGSPLEHEQLIICGMQNPDGSIRCRDGCVVTLGDGG